MRASWWIVFAIGCGGGARPPSHHAEPPVVDPAIIILERTECYGNCPVYTVAITEHGKVTFTGTDWVKVKTGETVLATAQLQTLVDAFAAAIPAMPTDFKSTTLDAPELFITYRGKRIHYGSGVAFRGTPEAAQRETIVHLAEAVDAAVAIERWTGTPAERDAQYEAWIRARVKKRCDALAGQARLDCYDDAGVTP